jgi:hypothetical protein
MLKLTEGKEMQELREHLGLSEPFAAKLLRIEYLTMLAKQDGIDARYECPPDEGFPTIAVRIRSLIDSLTNEETKIVENHLKDNFWYPGNWSCGDY